MNERKLSIIRETTEKDDQIKKFNDEIDKLNHTLTKERRESEDKVCSNYFFLLSSIPPLNLKANRNSIHDKCALFLAFSV